MDAVAAATASPARAHEGLTALAPSFAPHDLRSVTVHDGSEAVLATRALGVTAFTGGQHIVLGPRANAFTLAHEAVHAVLQGQGKGPPSTGSPDDPFECQADRLAATALSQGHHASPEAGDVGSLLGEPRRATPVAALQAQEEPERPLALSFDMFDEAAVDRLAAFLADLAAGQRVVVKVHAQDLMEGALAMLEQAAARAGRSDIELQVDAEAPILPLHLVDSADQAPSFRSDGGQTDGRVDVTAGPAPPSAPRTPEVARPTTPPPAPVRTQPPAIANPSVPPVRQAPVGEKARVLAEARVMLGRHLIEASVFGREPEEAEAAAGRAWGDVEAVAGAALDGAIELIRGTADPGEREFVLVWVAFDVVRSTDSRGHVPAIRTSAPALLAIPAVRDAQRWWRAVQETAA